MLNLFGAKEVSRPELVVHVGGAKCGSSAVQDILRVNRNKLAPQGICVPNTEMTYGKGQANLVWYFQNMIGTPDATEKLQRDVKALASSFKRSTGQSPKQIILSAENLSNPHELHEAVRPLKEDFSVTVVLYVRRQEDAYHAGWLQWFLKTHDNMDDWVRTTNGFFCDWDATLTRWESIEPDQIIVRLFSPENLVNGSVSDDFCQLVGIDMEGLYNTRPKVNESYGVHISRLLHDINGIFENEHDTAIQGLLFDNKVESAKKRPGESLFTIEQMDLIRERHAPGNAKVKERYFPDLDRPTLFEPIDYSKVSCPDQAEINRRNIAVLAELVLKLHLQLKGSETTPAAKGPGA